MLGTIVRTKFYAIMLVYFHRMLIVGNSSKGRSTPSKNGESEIV